MEKQVKMCKVTTLSDEVYSRIRKDGRLGSELRAALGIPRTKKMRIGDTLVRIGVPSLPKEVFKYTQNNHTVYYVVVQPRDGDSIDREFAFCYAIYPC